MSDVAHDMALLREALDNAGVELVCVYWSEEKIVVLAKRLFPVWQELPYVSWRYDTGADLFWGHYDLSEEVAKDDFFHRAQS